MSAPPESQPDWAAFRSTIEDLYWKDEKELPEVMKTMQDTYGFNATVKMYKKRFREWGLVKNLKAEESMAMLQIAGRRLQENKATEFIRRGKVVKRGNLRRFAKRRGLTAQGGAGFPSDAQVATPPNVTYRTPEPDRPNNFSLPLAPLPHVESEASEGEHAAVGGSPGSYDLDSEASPVSGYVQWVPPMANPWPSDETYTGSQGQTHTSVSPAFLPEPFYESREHTGGYLPSNSVPAFAGHHWSDSTDPSSHGYHSSGATDCWGLVHQPQQQGSHSLGRGLDGNVPVFSTSCRPTMAQATPAVETFRSIDQTQSIHRIPGTVMCVLDHAPLHNAVVCNDLQAAKTQLEAGANPNCAARGGMTPLHYAATQRNGDMVKLLLHHGANPDAETDKNRSVLFFAVRNRAHSADNDMLAYNGKVSSMGSGSHTDEDTVRVIDALFDWPTRWRRLLRSLEKADKDGVTPLMIAADEGFTKTATMLLRLGARPEVRDHANHTALKYAARANNRDLVRLLLLADPAVSSERDLSHILKLASKNFTARITVHGGGGVQQQILWDEGHRFAGALIAEEMVRLCREMGVLDDLLNLAEQRRKTNVLEFLLDAIRKLDMQGGPVGCGS